MVYLFSATTYPLLLIFLCLCAGRHISSKPLARLSSQASHESNCYKNSDKNRGSFVPFVISFSDDDSGSDSEDTRQRNTLETGSRSLSLDKSRKPPQAAATVRRPKKLEKVMQNEAKMMRKMPLSQTFVSSLPKISGTTSKSGGSSLNVRNHNNFKKTTGPSLVRNTNAILDNSKLQDLRQLIAVRENELKLKSAQQSRNIFSTKCRDPCVTVSGNAMTSERRATDGENLHRELREPSNKLQRISEDCSSQMVQNIQVIDTAVAEMSMLENCDQPGQGDRNSHNEKFSSGEPCTGLGLNHSENENQGSIFLTKLASGMKKCKDIIFEELILPFVTTQALKDGCLLLYRYRCSNKSKSQWLENKPKGSCEGIRTSCSCQ